MSLLETIPCLHGVTRSIRDLHNICVQHLYGSSRGVNCQLESGLSGLYRCNGCALGVVTSRQATNGGYSQYVTFASMGLVDRLPLVFHGVRHIHVPA